MERVKDIVEKGDGLKNLAQRVVIRYKINETLEKMNPEERYSLCLNVIANGSNNDKLLNELVLSGVDLNDVRIIYETEAVKQAVKLVDGNGTKAESLLISLLHRAQDGSKRTPKDELRNEIHKSIELLAEKCHPSQLEVRIINDELERLTIKLGSTDNAKIEKTGIASGEDKAPKSLTQRWRRIPLFDKLAVSLTMVLFVSGIVFHVAREYGSNDQHNERLVEIHPIETEKRPIEYKSHVISHERIPWQVVTQYFPDDEVSEILRRCKEFISRNPNTYDKLTPGMRTQIPPNWKKKNFKIYISDRPDVPFGVARRYWPVASTAELREYAKTIKKMNPDKYDKIRNGTRLRIPRDWELKLGEPWQEIGLKGVK